LTPEELKASKLPQNLLFDEPRWVAFKPAQPFPHDVAVVINIGPHIPSKEGQLTSSDVCKVEFHTASLFSALRLHLPDFITSNAVELAFNQPIKPAADNQNRPNSQNEKKVKASLSSSQYSTAQQHIGFERAANRRTEPSPCEEAIFCCLVDARERRSGRRLGDRISHGDFLYTYSSIC
jgi:hypothetical protein